MTAKITDYRAHIEANAMPIPHCGCWVWMGCLTRGGYGSLRYNGPTRLAHRVSWLAFKGVIPADRDVLHQCDEPSCVNPDHLFLGDHSDNMRDMFAKGRGNRVTGERHHKSKLTVEDVRSIRASGLSAYAVAKQYDMDKSTIQDVLNRKTWKHVD